VTVFGQANHLSMQPATHANSASYTLYAEREMSTTHSAVTLCDWGVKGGWLIPYVNKRVGGR